MSILHPLYIRVQPGQRRPLSRNQAPAGGGAVRLIVTGLPTRTHFRIAAHRGILIPKNQVCPFHQFFPGFGQRRMRGGCSRIPVFKERRHRPGSRGGSPVKQFQMQRFACGKTGGGALGLALAVRAEQIPAVVKQKIGRYPRRVLTRHGDLHHPGSHHRLLSPHLFRLQRQQAQQPAVPRQIQPIGDLRPRPTGPDNLTGRQQILIVLYQSLQDHRNTSQSSVSSTPFSSRARKNKGVTPAGSV